MSASAVHFLRAAPGSSRERVRQSKADRWPALLESVATMGWGGACWAYAVTSPWGWAGVALGVAAPLAAAFTRPRSD